MEEVDYTAEYQLLFGRFAAAQPNEKKCIAALGKLTKPQPGRLTDLVRFLLRKDIPLPIINFSQLLKYLRVVARAAVVAKQAPLQELVASLVVRVAQTYLPEQITTPRELRVLTRLAGILRPLSMRVPEKNSLVAQILLYLASGHKVDGALEEGLLGRLQEEVFIDRKARQSRHIRLNPIFGEFVARHFKVFLPLLERLVVRSESNLETWKDVFEATRNASQFDGYALGCLKHLKDLLIPNSAVTVPIVKNLTNGLKQPEIISECITVLEGIVNANPDLKKKVVGLQLLEGLITSASKLADEDKQLNRILLTFIRCFSRLDTDLFEPVLRLTRTLLAGKKHGGSKQISEALRLQIKGNNKYAHLCVAEVTAALYTHDNVATDKVLADLVKEFEVVNNKVGDKIAANIESYLASLYVLTLVKEADISKFNQAVFINKFDFLSTPGYLRDLYVRAAVRYLRDHTFADEDEVSTLGLSIFVGLALSKDLKVNLLKELNTDALLRVLNEGAYVYYWWNIGKVLPIKDESARRIVHYIVKKLQFEQDYEWNEQIAYRLIAVAGHFKEDKRILKKLLETTVKEHLNEPTEKALLTLLQAEFQAKPPASQDLLLSYLRIVFQMGVTPIEDLAALLITEANYRDVECLDDFNERLKESAANTLNEEAELLEKLKDIRFVVEGQDDADPKKEKKGKKPAASQFKAEEFKMMDEEEVKQDRLRRHFLDMQALYQRFWRALMLLILDQNCQQWFCDHYFEKYLGCMRHPELRFEFLLFTKRVFEAWKPFLRYADFLAEMFMKVGGQQVPRDHILELFEKFEADLLSMKFSDLPIHTINMLELVNSYLLANLDFDVNLKIYSVRFYLKLTEDERCLATLKKIYPYVISNINLLSGFPEAKELIVRLMRVIEFSHYTDILDDLLNYLPNSKRIVLQALLTTNNPHYTLSFEDYVKLRILENDMDASIATSAKNLLGVYSLKMDRAQIEHFDLKKFVERNSNQNTERLSNFARETFSKAENAETVEPMFQRVVETAKQLYDEEFDQEGLEFFANFLTINLDFVPREFFEPVFELLITRYTTNEELVTLMKVSLDAGISILKKYGKDEWELLLKILESHLKHDKGVANVVFLGVLAPYVKDNKNIAAIEKRITSMFESDNEYQQKAISKCMNELMSFFKEPAELVRKLFEKIPTLDGHLQIGQSYLMAGLLKGIGTNEMLNYFNKLLEGYENAKTPQEKKGRLFMLKALLDNFGRILEPRIISLMRVIVFFMSDANEAVRDTSREVAQAIMNKLSAYAVKNLLPELLGGLEKEENWRNKVTFIWALGNMAHCAPRQLQACLPKIVPTLSACLSDTHAKIRENATEALKVIGETIKNPEIFDSIEILISALSDPYHNSKKGLEVLLKTRFCHYIDPPALSVIVPIINYALRGRDSELKTYACQVIGSISILIENPDDLLPYIEFMTEGLRMTTCDQLSEIRNVATKALGKMSSKIGIPNTEKYLHFINEILQSETVNSVERQGAAQALSECMCSHGMDYFEESLLRVYNLLMKAKGNQKQGYISIFIYVPEILRQDFEPFIKEVTEHMAVFVSDEDESIRNASLQVQKILIGNFGLSHTEMLLEPLFDGLFEESWRKRNGSLILIGEMLNVLKSFLYDNSDTEKEDCYYQALMGVYIIKDDEVDMPRETAFKVWNEYIDNTPKTLKIGLGTLVKMWVRGIKQPASNIALRSITNFAIKYGETYFADVLDYFDEYINGKDDMLKSGVYDVLVEFLKKLQQAYLDKFKEQLRVLIDNGLFSSVQEIRRSVVKCLSIYVQKMHEVEYLEDQLAPKIKLVEQLSEQSKEFSDLLHLFGDLCNSSSRTIVESLLRKLVQKPLSEFKIEVLTNNAARLSNFLYSVFREKPATEMLKDEIVQEIKQGGQDDTKLKSLVYCFNEISVNLSEEHKGKFIQSLANDISTHSRAGLSNLSKVDRKLLETLLEILIFFLDGTPPEETGNLEKLITEITPLTFNRDQELMSLINKILSSLFRNPNKEYASNYFKQFAVCLENMISDRKLEGSLPIWEDTESAKLYVSIFVDTLVYGGVEMFADTLTVLQLFLKRAPLAVLQEAIVRIIGAIIRISSYRLNRKQKMELQQFIHTVYDGGRFPDLDCYKYQIVTLILKFIAGRDQETEAIEQAADNLIMVMSYSKKSNELLIDIASKVKAQGEAIVKCLYYIIKKIITTNLILDTFYDKILIDLTAVLNDTESQLSVTSCYYISKTAARIAVALNKPWTRYEQLVQGLTCPYNHMLQYLHFCYYSKNPPTAHEKICGMIRESSKDKVLYLLKSMKLLTKKYPQLKEAYSPEKTGDLVSQTIRGFEDIDDMIKSL